MISKERRSVLSAKKIVQTRYESEKKDWLKIEEALRSELKTLKEEREKNRTSLRLLEQKNDDLERAERINTACLEDMEKKMNETVERCAILENELAEKILSEEHNFRLRFHSPLAHFL